MGKVIDADFVANRLNKSPVEYTVQFFHVGDQFSIQVNDLDDNAESRKRLAYYLRKAAGMLENEDAKTS